MLTLLLLLIYASTPLDQAIALYEKRDYAAAAQALRSIPGRTARLYSARAAIALGRYADAVADVELALSGQPDPETRFRAGEILRELAEKRLADLEKTKPGSAAVLELTGESLERRGRRPEALQAYRDALAQEPHRPGMHYRIGNLLWRDRDLAGAQSELRQELARNPHHGLANLRLGQVLLARDEAAEAVAILESAVAALPASVDAQRELGKAYRKAGRPADARRAWEAVARVRPQDDQVHYLLGGLYRELGLTAEAAQAFARHTAILQRRASAARKGAN